MTHQAKGTATGRFGETYWKRAFCTIRSLQPIDWLPLVALVLGAAWLCCQPRATVMAQTTGIFSGGTPVQTFFTSFTSTKPPFVVRNYGGKCLDFGPPPQVSGTSVFISVCNGSIGQEVRIEEINAQHDVILRAGSKVIGVKPVLVSTAIQGVQQVESETPLELQDEINRNTVDSRWQVFALDGDSIMLASNRKRVIKVLNARGKDGTALVLGQRNLADAEFWTFTTTNGSSIRPTSGFVRISQTNTFDNGGELQARTDFLAAVKNAGWGAVIELDQNVAINLTNVPDVKIPAGVTIRGDRRGTRLGPQLRSSHAPSSWMLIISGNEVRITGLRVRGPSRSGVKDPTPSAGIQARDDYTSIIDHNDISDWQTSAVDVRGGDAVPYHPGPDPKSRPHNVRVARNFIHHNRMDAFGYGVCAGGYGGYPFIEGNTFMENRHAIAGDGTEATGYRAWYNLILHAAPDYGNGIQQDFDMHGTEDSLCKSHCGGDAGEYTEIARNTFLGSDRVYFDLRGTPTYLAEFHHNMLVSDKEVYRNLSIPPSKLIVSANQKLAENPALHLGVGDFDADGTQDLFLATGAAWYYAPSGKAEWRFINAQTDGIGKLLFGDFDDDGRTDVFTQHGYNWDVSWGGVSKWETINVSGAIMGYAAVGDFIGDERDDIFYADGQAWYASDGGAGYFTPLATSSYRGASLRFGDFDADGKTDVFSVVSGNWAVSYGGISVWNPLRSKLPESFASLIVADFNGDGRSDVATSTSSLPDDWDWKVSYSGTGNWTALRSAAVPLASAAAIGRFDSNASDDVLLWHNNYLDISVRGLGAGVRHTRQDVDLR